MRIRKLFFLVVCLVLALSSVGPLFAQDDVTLRLAWWGSQPRHEKYAVLADLYEETHPNITLEREFNDWGPYWELLATQVAAGNAPDIIHMHPNNVAEYALRGALLDLTPYVESGQLDLSKFPQGIIDSGKVDDKIYMVTLGNSSPGTHFNARMFEEAGIEFDKFAWTWQDYMDIALQLQETLPEGVWAAQDDSGSDQAWETFLRQRGKDFFIDGEIGFEKEDLVEFWGMYDTLRKAGAIPPADVMAEYDGVGHADSLLATGKVAMDILSGNQHRLYQVETEDPLDLAVIPRTAGSDNGGDVIGGAYLSCAADTQHPDECVEFINWMANDPDVAVIYNGEHGPPGNAEMAAMVAENADPADQRLFAMQAAIADTAALRGQRPLWGTEAGDAFTRIAEELAFGNYSVEEAVDVLFDEFEFISN